MRLNCTLIGYFNPLKYHILITVNDGLVNFPKGSPGSKVCSLCLLAISQYFH